MLKQTLSQKLLQKLSPQQIQFIKLLQVPTDMLEQRIKEELEINPALEEGASPEVADAYDFEEDHAPTVDDEYDEHSSNEDVDINAYLEADDTPDYKLSDNNYSADDDEDQYRTPAVFDYSFHEQLEDQLHLLELDDRLFKIGLQIIGSIDEDGYLRRTVQQMVNDLAFSQNIDCTEQEVADLLEDIQQFEPAGVGARDLKECLVLQLERKIWKPEVENALRIVNEAFESYSKRHFDAIMKQLGLTQEQLKKSHEVIMHLNPRPGGSAIGNDKTQQVIPDFIIHNDSGVLALRLNARNAPELRISQEYRDMFKQYDKSKDKKLKETVSFVKQKLDAAKWFIDAVKQRQHTLLSTMEAIMQHQYTYFLSGDKSKLKPMILKDIAKVTGLDISTVSRVANSKYVQTEFGTFLLKSFFSEGIQTESGDEASSIEVKNILTECINAEDKQNPMSDDALSEVLREKGYAIARRTVAKYREQLNIPVARLRREI